jgi:hypothetical protein
MYELERWRDNGKPPSVIGFYPDPTDNSVTFVVEHGYQSQSWKEICKQFEESSKKALGKEEFSLKVSLSPDTASVSTYFPLPWVRNGFEQLITKCTNTDLVTSVC